MSNKNNVETKCKKSYLESFATSFNACSYDETPLRSIVNEKKPRVKRGVSLKFSELNLRSSSLFRPNPFRGRLSLDFLIGNLSKDVFERRTSTGSEVFSLTICLDAKKFVLLSFFSLIRTIYLRVSTKPPPNDAKRPLPVDVRRSKTLLLKLPNKSNSPQYKLEGGLQSDACFCWINLGFWETAHLPLP